MYQPHAYSRIIAPRNAKCSFLKSWLGQKKYRGTAETTRARLVKNEESGFLPRIGPIQPKQPACSLRFATYWGEPPDGYPVQGEIPSQSQRFHVPALLRVKVAVAQRKIVALENPIVQLRQVEERRHRLPSALPTGEL